MKKKRSKNIRISFFDFVLVIIIGSLVNLMFGDDTLIQPVFDMLLLALITPFK